MGSIIEDKDKHVNIRGLKKKISEILTYVHVAISLFQQTFYMLIKNNSFVFHSSWIIVKCVKLKKAGTYNVPTDVKFYFYYPINIDTNKTIFSNILNKTNDTNNVKSMKG